MGGGGEGYDWKWVCSFGHVLGIFWATFNGAFPLPSSLSTPLLIPCLFLFAVRTCCTHSNFSWIRTPLAMFAVRVYVCVCEGESRCVGVWVCVDIVSGKSILMRIVLPFQKPFQTPWVAQEVQKPDKYVFSHNFSSCFFWGGNKCSIYCVVRDRESL